MAGPYVEQDELAPEEFGGALLDRARLDRAKEKLALLKANRDEYDPDTWRTAVRVLTAAIEKREAEETEALGPSAEQQELAQNPEAQEAENAALLGTAQRIMGSADPFAPQPMDPYSTARAQAVSTTSAEPGLPSQTGHTALYRPPMRRSEGGRLAAANADALWEEPTVESVREFLRQYMGDAADEVTEQSEEYKRAADFMYARAYDAASQEGRPLARVRYVDPLGSLPGVGGLSPVLRSLQAFRTGAGRSYSLGAEGAALKLDPTGVLGRMPGHAGVSEQAAADHPWAAAAGEVAGALMPGGGPMAILNKLAKGAGRVASAVAPAASGALRQAGARVGANAALGAGTGTLAGAAQDVMDAAGEMELPSVEEMGQNALGRAGAGALLGGAFSAAGEGIGALAQRGARAVSNPDYRALVERGRRVGVEPGVVGPRRPAALEAQAERGRLAESPLEPLDQAVEEAKPVLARAGIARQEQSSARRAAANEAYYAGAGAEARALDELADTTLEVSKRLARTETGAGPLPWHNPKVLARQLPRLFRARLVEESAVQDGATRTLTLDEAQALGVGEAFMMQVGRDPASKALLDDIATAQQYGGAPPRVAFELTPVRATAKELDDIQGAIDRDLVNARAGRSGREVDDDPVLKEIQIAGYRTRERFPAMPGVTPTEPVYIRGAQGEDVELRGWAAMKRRHAQEQTDEGDLFRAAGLPREIPARRAADSRAGLQQEAPNLTSEQWSELEGNLRRAGHPGRPRAERAQRELMGDAPELRLLEALTLSERLEAATPPVRALVSGGAQLRSGGMPISSVLLRMYPFLESLGANAATRAPTPGPYQAPRFGRNPARDIALRNRQLRLPIMMFPLEDE